ncbi:hypothetical protein MIR68_003947 [Amoeboaphelidium protococcarum]|nr:hypothetical protein MIR68_003947 [Amoeboaphelidium protococcarum]
MSNSKQVSSQTSDRKYNALAQQQTSFTNANQQYRDFKLDRMIYYGHHGDKNDERRDLITDYDLIRDRIKFVEDDHDDNYNVESTRGNIQSSKQQLNSEDYEKKALKKYNDMLYKEYCLTDVQLFIQNGGQKQIPLRWRVKDEVKSGKGERICGNISCDSTTGLSTYEVPFQYRDKTSAITTTTTTNDPSSVSSTNGSELNMKLVLVKLRVCSSCASILFKMSYRNPDKSNGSEVFNDIDRNIEISTDHNIETPRSRDRSSHLFYQDKQTQQIKASDDSKVAELNSNVQNFNRKRPASSTVRQKQYDDFLARKLKKLQ